VTPTTPEPRPPDPPAFVLTPAGLPNEDAFLLRYLQVHDAPCPVCGYNLRFLTEPRCPECGHAVRLRVAPKIPPMRAWLTLAMSTAASAGLGVLFTLIHPPSRFESGPAFWAEAYFYACIPLLAVILFVRRPITRLRSWVQWSIALPLAFLSLVALVVAIAMF
jgi:hypothetical protein